MSCTGKSTLAQYVAARLRQVDRNVEILDENTLLDDFWAQQEESKEDRNNLVRRLGLLASMLSRNNVAALVASVSPYKATREENRRLIGRYVEVYVDCPTEKLIQRDSSGRYKKALTGLIGFLVNLQPVVGVKNIGGARRPGKPKGIFGVVRVVGVRHRQGSPLPR